MFQTTHMATTTSTTARRHPPTTTNLNKRRAALAEFRVGTPEAGRSVFEGLVANHPRRTDLWNVYIDQVCVLVLCCVPCACLSVCLSCLVLCLFFRAWNWEAPACLFFRVGNGGKAASS